MKQTDHLRALARSLRESVYPTIRSLDTPVHLLVLDDEADDGSILDARVEASEDPIYGNLKQIPRAIADLWAPPSLQTVPRNLFATYVGYTATPQANFLQEEHNPLAPREFVLSLRTPLDRGELRPRSSTYFEPTGLANYYTGGEVFYRRGTPAGLCVATSNNLDEDRADAVRAFLVAGAIRTLRASSRLGPTTASSQTFASREEVLAAIPPIHSMLVHPSALVDEQFQEAARILEWAGARSPEESESIMNSGGYLPEILAAKVDEEEDKWQAWVERYRSSAEAVHFAFSTPTPNAIPSWSEIRGALIQEIIPNTRVAVVNSDPGADDRPEYEPWCDADGNWHAPRDLSTIFVSGNVMSRGLTLEGLTTTLFLRTSNQALADSQMQMQRWFGYRGAYIELCRIFAPQPQLDFFTAYHEVDEALRQILTDAMQEDASAPDPVVLQGQGFLATGKIANLGNQPLCPGPKPFIRLINSGDQYDPNVNLLSDLFEERASSNVTAGGRIRGRMLNQPLALNEAAALLDRLQFRDYNPDRSNWQNTIWNQVQQRVEAHGSLSDSQPLYRPPLTSDSPISPVRRDCPYAIAAYFRLWSACLSRHVRGLFPTDGPLRQWSMTDLNAKTQQQPRFWVGIRYGGGLPVSEVPLSTLPFVIPAAQRTVLGGNLAATWGSRDPDADAEGFRGDEYLDYYFRGETLPPIPVDESPWRPPGSDGLILFYVNQPEGQAHPTIAVGVCIPLGGPDQFAAATAPRQFSIST
ncbi:Z1 domain-containing protein [Paenarthrobacter aurescens]|nr:Z1 domain-containing protein [Paenarthrobacter aurescens]